MVWLWPPYCYISFKSAWAN